MGGRSFASTAIAVMSKARERWRRGYNGRGDIDITEWNGRRTSGSASLTYRGRDIERVGVNIPAQNARVEFSPVAGGPGNIGGGNTNAARPVNTSFVGTGGFRERGRTYQLSDASIRLRDNGEAELRFEGDRRTEGRGRWTADGIYARISITEWDGRRANGSGTITFSRNLPDQVNLTRRAGRSRSVPTPGSSHADARNPDPRLEILWVSS